MKRRLTRRDMLRRSAALGTVAAVPANVLAQAAQAAPYVHLTAAEAATLEAVVARLIPADRSGPGALEAGAARYIDNALGDALAGQRPAYSAGLAALDAYARAQAGGSFASLAPARQDELLTELEQNRARGFTPSSSAFFELVLGHTLEGTFGDPHYGGNQGYIGWELIGYPGLRLAVTAEQQQMNAALEPIRSSAYDHAQFDAHTTAGERDDD
ncbi:MAG TPA: gluconate 2-dehydrogenase subunit 3 family protein [Gammaproteobacteria bacterium]|nr:gluconate 2-dehydrogenase subunit 3 family protein [Gammaproteobacteria bacterium]